MSLACGTAFQCLSGRIGLVTGKDLAAHCGERWPRGAAIFLWIMLELAIVAVDIQVGLWVFGIALQGYLVSCVDHAGAGDCGGGHPGWLFVVCSCWCPLLSSYRGWSCEDHGGAGFAAAHVQVKQQLAAGHLVLSGATVGPHPRPIPPLAVR